MSRAQPAACSVGTYAYAVSMYGCCDVCVFGSHGECNMQTFHAPDEGCELDLLRCSGWGGSQSSNLCMCRWHSLRCSHLVGSISRRRAGDGMAHVRDDTHAPGCGRDHVISTEAAQGLQW